ncbi:hypothetical protein L2E82_24856 [Cichorium intybus]|uniref:Uncharacterized protein n=1 Tax=Cichorium intybus TaxID=13427 RepID=A0ACB9E1K9_CICIN|nr:hypothetical protein L2E82_24856 [Cichorium intybus]
MVGRGSFSTLEEMLSVPNSEMRHDDDIINGEYIRSTSRSRSVPPSFHYQSHSDLKIVVHSEPVHRIKSKGVKGNFNRREDSRSKNVRYTKRCNACSPELDDYSPECHSGRRVEQELLVSNIDDPPINSATVDEDSLISQEQWSAKSGVTVSIQLSGPKPESSKGSKEVDQCGQLSLLEASPIEDVSSGSDCFEGVSSRLLGNVTERQVQRKVRGDTTHYDAVANSATSGVLSAGLNSTLNRAGGKAGNKGSDAALTAGKLVFFISKCLHDTGECEMEKEAEIGSLI